MPTLTSPTAELRVLAVSFGGWVSRYDPVGRVAVVHFSILTPSGRRPADELIKALGSGLALGPCVAVVAVP